MAPCPGKTMFGLEIRLYNHEYDNLHINNTLKFHLVDCQWQEWGAWSQCSSTCGNGQRSSLRIVKQEAKNGGEPCNEIFERHETCTNRPCQGTARYIF